LDQICPRHSALAFLGRTPPLSGRQEAIAIEAE
jgi:hypothetical protein